MNELDSFLEPEVETPEVPEVPVVEETGDNKEVPPTPEPPQDDTAAKLKAFEAKAVDEVRKRQQAETRSAQLEQQLQAKQEEEKPFLGEEYEARFNETEAKFNQALLTQKLNLSESFAREKHADFEDKLELFKGLIQENPALYHQMTQQVNPAEFMYKTASNQLKLKEMADPEEYEKKLIAKITAETEAKYKKQYDDESAKRDSLPGSLAGARGAAGAHTAVWSGPPPLDDVLGNKK